MPRRSGVTQSPDDRPRSTMTIYAEKVVIIQSDPTPKKPPSRKRYLANAALFAVLMLVITLWFTAHVEAYVTQKAIVGGVTLYALVQLILSLGKRDFEDVAGDIRKSWLASPRTTGTLAILIFCTGALFAVTSSLYFKIDRYDGPVRIEVLTAEGRLMPPVNLDRDIRSAGQPFFPRFKIEEVRLVVKEPRGWRLNDPKPPFTFYPWSRRELRFPKDFVPPEFHILRIVPGFGLNDELTDCKDCRLTVTTPKREVIAEAKDYTFRTVYLGTPAQEDLQPFMTKDAEGFRRELERHITAAGAAPFGPSYLALWLGSPALGTSTRDLGPEEDVIITVTKGDRTLLAVPSKAPKDELKTVILETGGTS